MININLSPSREILRTLNILLDDNCKKLNLHFSVNKLRRKYYLRSEFKRQEYGYINDSLHHRSDEEDDFMDEKRRILDVPLRIDTRKIGKSCPTSLVGLKVRIMIPTIYLMYLHLFKNVC